MRYTRAIARALASLAAAGLLVGCATPIGIRTADPIEVQRYLTRSALTGQTPSDFSLNELRRYDLLETFNDEPDAALAKLHTAALARDLPPDALFALAELSFLRAHETQLQASYAAALIYSYAFLFPEQGGASLNEFDPRERIAADLYNRALTSAFRLSKLGTIAVPANAVTDVALPFGSIRVTRAPDLLRMQGVEFYDVEPVAQIEVRGLRNRYRQPGIGAPLAAKTRPSPGAVQVVPIGALVRIPLAAMLLIDTPLAGLRSGKLTANLVLFATHDTDTIEIDGRPIPLEAEPTAALAASLSEAQFWKKELAAFLGDAIGLRKQSALIAIRPYTQGRIPVVFVHGTASSPARWADMANDLLADAYLRDHYAFWFFTYDSGNPIAYSAHQLRTALTQAVERADPSGGNPCARDMVVMGHSQGGLLTKLTAIDSGNIFWAGISNTPLDEIKLAPAEKELLRGVAFVKPLPFVTEVLFLATPQRGSYLAGPQFVRRLAAYFVRLPSEVVRVGADLAAHAPAGEAGLSLGRIPTSIDNMSPNNRFIQALAKIPVSPDVKTHSIIAVDSDEPLDQAGDGVVKYASAHIEGVDSELIVRSPHSGMQAAPATIEEVRRILFAHAERSTCLAPAR